MKSTQMRGLQIQKMQMGDKDKGIKYRGGIMTHETIEGIMIHMRQRHTQ